jgi:RNA polymerase sigma-70 factor (ECF subfamily)
VGRFVRQCSWAPGRRDRLDEERIGEFLRDDYPRLVATLTAITGSRAVAEDAVQEALVRAWERSDRGEHIERLSAWVARVALNVTRSGMRRFRAESRARSRLSIQTPAGSDDRIDVLRALATLPRRQREVMVLRYLLEFDVTEISKVLRVHEGTVKTSLHRARKSLAATLRVPEESEEVDDPANP